MMDAFAAEIEAAHKRGERLQAAVGARAAEQARPTRGDQGRSWLSPGRGVASTVGIAPVTASHRSLLSWGWIEALVGRPA